ncbi:MAG: lipid-A-disaccharide synthase [Saprospiraceae bacterium]|nr:lipid-A-disaccharide synthase [Saprospiraceae bacterium]
MRYYIIAGEASGDLHGSNLIKALQKNDNQAVIRAWGGDMMAAAGADVRKHYRDLAFMGFLEVVKNLRTILGNMAFCKRDILEFKPDVVIFIDYPGFNLRIAKWLHDYQRAKILKIKRFYYISPQIWAWHTSRVHLINRIMDKVFCILPFEKDFYQKYNYEVDYIGHPLLDVVKNAQDTEGGRLEDILDKNKPVVAILAGSRRQEIEAMLPKMLEIVPFFPDYQFVIAAASAQNLSYYDKFISNMAGNSSIKIVQNQTYDVLKIASAALVKSGTSTLETALFGVPQVVCYKGSALSFAIAKRVVKIKYISLVNLIADKEIVKELIQDDFTVENLRIELTKAIENQEIMKKNYAILRGLLGNEGASDRAGALMVKYLEK